MLLLMIKLYCAQSLNTSHIAKIFKTLAKKANLNGSVKQDISGNYSLLGHAHNLLREGKSLPSWCYRRFEVNRSRTMVY